jgi:hypothetical protein
MRPVDYTKLDWRERRRVRLEYIAFQEGKCCHCGEALDGRAREDVARKSINKRMFPKSFWDYPSHLHHNHETGMTIGAVHNQCNAVLWQYHGK